MDRPGVAPQPRQKPRQWIDKDRCVLVSLWPTGAMCVARRDHPADVWGPPVRVYPEGSRDGSEPLVVEAENLDDAVCQYAEPVALSRRRAAE